MSFIKLAQQMPLIKPLYQHWISHGYREKNAHLFSILAILPLSTGPYKSKSKTPTLALNSDIVKKMSAKEKLKHKYIEADIRDNKFLAFFKYFFALPDNFHFFPKFVVSQLKLYIEEKMGVSEYNLENLTLAFHKKAHEFERFRCVAKACTEKELTKVFGTNINTTKNFLGNTQYKLSTTNKYEYRQDQEIFTK